MPKLTAATVRNSRNSSASLAASLERRSSIA
jgi:hypothetical protein